MIQHIFLVVNSFLQLDFIIAMIYILTCQICILGSVVRALRFVSERLPVLIQTVCSDSNGVHSHASDTQGKAKAPQYCMPVMSKKAK